MIQPQWKTYESTLNTMRKPMKAPVRMRLLFT